MSAKIRILIADDDEDDIGLLTDGLADVINNFEITTASNGLEFLKQVKGGFNPDLVFLDVNMPLKNGLECLRDIQKDNFTIATPVIVYSTSQNTKDINAASTYGARFYMVKPNSYDALKIMLSRALELLGQPLQVQSLPENFLIACNKL